MFVSQVLYNIARAPATAVYNIIAVFMTILFTFNIKSDKLA